MATMLRVSGEIMMLTFIVIAVALALWNACAIFLLYCRDDPRLTVTMLFALVGVVGFFRKSTTHPPVVRSTSTCFAALPVDVGQLVLNVAGLPSSGKIACTSRHWCETCRHWRRAMPHIIFTPAERKWVSDIMIAALVRDCPMLLRVDLTNCQKVGGASIRALAKACPLLEEVSLPGAEGVGSIFARKPERPVEEADLVQLANGCPSLRVISGACSTFGDNALIALGKCCTHLRVLTITRCPDVRATDVGLLSLAARCHELQRIDLTGGWSMSDDGTKGSLITDEGVAALARGCRQLTHVNLRCYVGLTDESVVILASCCRDLEELNVGDCHRLSDASLDSLAQHCEHLRRLQYAEEGVTAAAVDRLLARCTDLVNLGAGWLIYNDHHHDHHHTDSDPHHHIHS